MRVDVMTGGGMGLEAFQRFAHRAADAGFSGLVVTESGTTAYLACAAAAVSGADVDVLTGVAVAFPRSPMVTASTAWELAAATGGRFRLGLGPQVRAHVERRYSAIFDPPGPRMREYVLALRAIFAAFRRDAKLDFHGDYYDLSLLPPMWNPGPISEPDPPIDLAAVNPWMLRATGEVADGVHVHPLNTPTYLRETLVPNLSAGVARAGRSLDDLVVIVPCFTALGDTEEERTRWRELSRTMVAFYGSTPNYGFIFEQLGFPGTTERIRVAQKAGDMPAMAAAIPDDCLDHFVVEGPWDEAAARIIERCSPVAQRVVLYHAGTAAQQPGDTFERLGAVARAVTLATADD